MSAEPLASGEVSRRFNISARQLKHWRKVGLLAPSHRTAGGHSRYTEQDVRRAGLIRAMLRAGYTLPTIRRSVDVINAYMEKAIEECCTRTAEDVLTAIRKNGYRCGTNSREP